MVPSARIPASLQVDHLFKHWSLIISLLPYSIIPYSFLYFQLYIGVGYFMHTYIIKFLFFNILSLITCSPFSEEIPCKIIKPSNFIPHLLIYLVKYTWTMLLLVSDQFLIVRWVVDTAHKFDRFNVCIFSSHCAGNHLYVSSLFKLHPFHDFICSVCYF